MRIPGYTSTGSKRPESLFGVSDEFVPRIERSAGCRVWDVHGRDYVDFTMALGAVALGYGHPAVAEAVVRAARDGGVGGLSPRLEAELAERLCGVLPGAESVRFFKTGAEAVAAAVRVARVVTGREPVVTCGYHGWLDWCSEGPGVPAAVQADRHEIPFNDVPALVRVLQATKPAAVVVEPVVDEEPRAEWLEALASETRRAGTLLVFDEIKTAFRLARGGVAEARGCVPDLIVVGKALGNGMPIAAVAGPATLMDAATRTWISSTLATEWVSMAAALAVLDTFEREPVLEHLDRLGRRLWSGLATLATEVSGLERRGVPQMCYLAFADEALGAQVARYAAKRGLLFKRTAYNFVSFAHAERDVDHALEIVHTALRERPRAD